MPKHETVADDLRGKWMAASEEMRARIDSGRWRAGRRLPSVAELCADLAITHPTLRKAMARLAKAGLVEPLARGWRVSARGRVGSGLAVGFLRRCHPDGEPFVEAEREKFFRRALELEASRCGVRLERWGVAEDGTLFRGRDVWTGNLGRTLGGMVVSLWGMWSHTRHLPFLHGCPVPLAVWDERSDENERPTFAKVRWFRSERPEQGGNSVGRHLVDMGHRRVAWISPFEGRAWSTGRRRGLQEICSQATPPVELCVFGSADRWDPVQFLPPREEVAGLLEPLSVRLPEQLGQVLEETVESARFAIRDGEILRSLDDLFRGARAVPGLTAWVCVNDDIARLAVSWLRAQGLVPGRDLALVGFDNTLKAQDLELTSVGFQEEDLAAGMFAYVLDPSRWRSNGEAVHPGSLVVRSSTTMRPGAA
ncbi:MAG: substrate-binding domain-containing protein [Fibrobacteria bacterium]|nr:substrate-binding domain-containing protein [Fibrobacteria bacterium]